MLSSGSSGSSSRDHLRLVSPARSPSEGSSELGRDWLEACRERVQNRMARASGPLQPLQGPVGLDEDPPDSRLDGWPDRLASAWSALRAWRHPEAGEALPTVQHEQLRVPARVTLPQRRR